MPSDFLPENAREGRIADALVHTLGSLAEAPEQKSEASHCCDKYANVPIKYFQGTVLHVVSNDFIVCPTIRKHWIWKGRTR